jgi:hypothetical protein
MDVETFTPKQLSAELFIGRLRGGSQPILVQASDGFLYVVKYQDNPQGPNVPFNEGLGSVLFDACGLRVPSWAAIEVSDGFLDRHPEGWIWEGREYRRPKAGWCFGSRYQGMGETQVLEVLSRSAFNRVNNRQDFWKAWFLDILCEHCDHRQTLFLRNDAGDMDAVFFDHGHLFGGPNGDTTPKLLASRYLDSRIYEDLAVEGCNRIAHIIESLNQEKLNRIVANMPQEWVTSSVIGQFHQLLVRLSDGFLVENVSNYLRSSCFQLRGESPEQRKTARAERFRGGILPAGLSGVRYA